MLLSEALDVGSVIVALLAALASIVGARYVFSAELAKAKQSKDAVAWQQYSGYAEALSQRVESLEAELSRLMAEVHELRAARVVDDHVRLYAVALLEAWPRPPGPPPAPAPVLEALGLLDDKTHHSPKSGGGGIREQP